MFGRIRGRDILLIAVLMGIGVLLLGIGLWGTDQVREQTVRAQTKTHAVSWGKYVLDWLDNPTATLAYGKIGEKDQKMLEQVSVAGNIFRYRFFNSNGVVVLASRPEDLGKRDQAELFKNFLSKNRPVVRLAKGPFKDLKGNEAPVVTEAYVPVSHNGRFRGAIQIYVDVTKRVALLNENLLRVKLLLVAIVLMFFVAVIVIMGQNIRDRNREVATISRAHESLARAEQEVLKLNEDLERRVEERTRELAKANEDVKRLNEDLERRVQERTEQLNKTNEQLYKAVETANKINETLEQRVAERTGELNSVNETVMRLNTELEQRVEERTGELNKAYEDIQQLNTGLERRVEERTAELARANDDINSLNEDLERRVEERTSELAKANEDIQTLNTDLERRVDERTSELGRANEDIKLLNEDLERRVDERTDELKATQAELLTAERLATLGQLTATVSHELRNPLGAIRTAVYLISTITRGKGMGVEDAIDRAERSIGRCDSIINELLDFTRETPLALEDTEMDDWLGQVLEEQNIPNQVSLNKEFGADGVHLSFDRERLRRVVINLVSNACEAMREQAQTDAQNDQPVKDYYLNVVTTATPERMEVVVSDNGPGIEADKLARIFEPLFSTKSFGVGLGLPIVKQIMEQHGGDIQITSDEGEGATARLWIPTDLGTEDARYDGQEDGQRDARSNQERVA